MLRSVGFKLDRAAQNAYLFAVSDLISLVQTRSDGCGWPDLILAALSGSVRRRRSASGGAGVAGSEGEAGRAYQARRDLLMLEVGLATRGAQGVAANCSSEKLRAAVLSGCYRGRCCRSPGGKQNA